MEGVSEDDQRAITEWEGVLESLETDPRSAADRLDWAAKLVLMEQYRDREGLAWKDAKLKMIDLQYHDVDRSRGLYHRLVAAGRVRRLFDDAQIERAAIEPPDDTRAFFRGRCVERFGPAIVAANWDSLIFDVGRDVLKRVPMMEPLRGSRAVVGDLIDGADTAAELVEALGTPDGADG
jgi:proteasome accessory factor A